ncbi:LysE family transporter [Paracidovorax wautersii]|uniref:LysE family transporter n=1 Tax=Paracidovorax wautersii TaxID=1177982 RepID=UPI0031DFF05C
MTGLFVAAFLLGLVFNAAPGAVFAETVRQGVRGGFRPALAVQVGSLVGDATWAVLGLAGIGMAMQIEALRWPVGLAGAAYLAWLSWDSWRAARVEHALDAAAPAQAGRQALQSGMVLSLTNPQNLAYWAAMGSALGAVGVTHPTAGDYGIFFAGFMASSVLWCFACAAVVDRLFRRAGARWARFTYRLCAAVLLALALGTLRDLLQGAPATSPSAPAAAPATLALPR